MITVTLTFMGASARYVFKTLTEALTFARSRDIGVSYRITENDTVLAKGKIEDYKDI